MLNLSSLPCLGAGASSQEAAAEAASTLAAILSCAPQLRQLYLDELLVSETACKALGQVCVNLEDASLVACKRMTDTGLQYIAQGCQKMRSLSIGGAASSFSEATGLGAFTQLTKLVLVRRPTCTDTEFQGLMSSLRGLQEVKLASLSRITDTGLAALPAGLTSLTLVMCENVKGASLARLTRLRELRLRHCPAMNPQHLQVSDLWSMIFYAQVLIANEWCEKCIFGDSRPPGRVWPCLAGSCCCAADSNTPGPAQTCNIPWGQELLHVCMGKRGGLNWQQRLSGRASQPVL